VLPLALLLLVIPFVLPFVSLAMLADVKRRLRDVEDQLDQQRSAIDALAKRLRETRAAPAEAHPAPAAPPPAPTPTVPPPITTPQRSIAPPHVTPAPVTPPPVITPPAPQPRSIAPPSSAAPAPPVAHEKAAAPVAPRPTAPPPPSPPPPPPVAREPFDWEQLIGVKMFSAVAGVALVLAAVFFLRYSIDQGWLTPPIRVAIGLMTAIALLVACELRAARRYPVTANAMDAAAIAILFATVFAAHALWKLIPATAAFGFLALITAAAVLLSIRRASLFIAVLGLLGGFATPVLLSTGENRPVPLFAYLLMLNVGLAWVARRQRWWMLTMLTLAFTTVYQWGWVIRFLSVSQLSLAMGIFLLFAVTGFVALTSSAAVLSEAAERQTLGQVGLAAAAMPVIFAAYLAAVPAYGARPGLLFGFLFIVDAGLLAVTIGRGEQLAHAIGAGAAVVVFAVWLAMSYASSAWLVAVGSVCAFVALFALAPVVAARLSRPLTGFAARAVYAAPILLFVFPVIARIEPAAESPLALFAPMFVLLALIAWRAIASGEFGLYLIAAFFGLVAEAAWSATYLTAEHLRAAVMLYVAFGLFYLGVPLAARRSGRAIEPRWGGGAVLIASLLILLFLSAGPRSTSVLWGLAVLLAILDAGIFIESAAGGLPMLSLAGGVLSWLVLAVWWGNAAASVGLLPSLLFLVGLTLMMLVGHSWAHRQTAARSGGDVPFGFRQGTYLGLVGHLFLFFTAIQPRWSTPPWPLFAALFVLTLASSASWLAIDAAELHAAGVVAAAVIVLGWAQVSASAWSPVMLVAGELVVAYGLGWLAIARRRGSSSTVAKSAAAALFVAELTVIAASGSNTPVPVAIVTAVHAVNLALVFALSWMYQWQWVAPAAVVPAWLAVSTWQREHADASAWRSTLMLAAMLYAVFAAYPFVLGRRTRDQRSPFITAMAGSVFFFFAGRAALLQGFHSQFVGIVPIVAAVVMTMLLRQLLRLEPMGSRDLGRLALVAGGALAFATVAIPLQLNRQWITIGWALEGAALAWTYRRIPHRGLFYWSGALLAVVFVRLALNPAVLVYEPRGMRVFNWYLYAYAVSAASMFLAAWWLSKTDDRLLPPLPRASSLLPAAGVILLFLLLNIEIADYYATGPEITFQFGVTLAQDLTYTIGWLVFGLLLLTAGIYLHSRPGRITAVALIAVTACKAFLYDMWSLGGLYRVMSLVGLAVSLALVALALQKFVLRDSGEQQ